MLGFGPDMFCTGDAGYGPEEETCVFELTYNYGKDKYDNFKGEGYAQVALSSEVQWYCSPATPMSWHAWSSNSGVWWADHAKYFKAFQATAGAAWPPCLQIAFAQNPIMQAWMLNTASWLLMMLCWIAACSVHWNCWWTLNQLGTTKHHFACTTLYGCCLQDVYKTAEAVKQLSGDLGGKVVREPGPLPGLKTKITSVEDPDGWKVVFVDNKDFLAEL